MKILTSIVMALLLFVAPATLLAKSKNGTTQTFSQKKRKALMKIDKKIRTLNGVRACLKKAKTKEALKACKKKGKKKKNKKAKKNKKSQNK